jgi:rhamnosyltransferase
MSSKKPTIGIAIISYKDKKHLKRCIPPLLASPLKPRVVVFNSDYADDGTIKPTNDGTSEEAKRLGAEVFPVPRVQMNHGWARERTRLLLGTDIVVNMTPDAYFEDKNMLEKLVKPIIEGRASIAYARQKARPDADPVGTFSRMFSYPEESNVRSIKDAERYGSYTNFCSDACAAWDMKALDSIGGFPWILSGEDAAATSLLMKKGHKIAYVAEAVVEHSHNYGPKKEFIRHFDTGMYRRRWAKVLDVGTGSDESRGVSYAKKLLLFTLKTKPFLTPRVFMQLVLGYLGYRVGWISYKWAPHWFKEKFSPADFFWQSVDYHEGRWDNPIDSKELLFGKAKRSY